MRLIRSGIGVLAEHATCGIGHLVAQEMVQLPTWITTLCCRWRTRRQPSGHIGPRWLGVQARPLRQTSRRQQRSAPSCSVQASTPAPSRAWESTAAWQTTWKVCRLAL